MGKGLHGGARDKQCCFGLEIPVFLSFSCSY